MTRQDWLKIVGLIMVGLCVFGIGFWLGNKTVKNTTSSEVAGTKLVVEKKVNAVSVPGVEWIKAGQQPICPDTHPYKGKFDSYTGYFYAPDYKTYDKIKPVLCFATEEYATQKAGFLKKY